ncbi:MAG: acyltransferase [Candidatus Faecousia sp.]|nr:acyltransferase [Candidatus Faecousia sp.]
MGLKKLSGFTLLKLIAAFQVVYIHLITHFHLPPVPFIKPPDVFRFLSPFDGVPVFFSLSGYFLWKSLSARPLGFRDYARRRVIRIFPELWMVVAFSIVSILIFCRQELSALPFLGWIGAQATFLQFWTPECLRSFGTGCPNGSLWTITIFLQFYLVVFFLHRLLHGKKLIAWLLTLLVSAGLNVIPGYFASDVTQLPYKLYQQLLLPYLSVFLFTACVAEFEDVIGGKRKSILLVIALYAVLVIGIPFDFQGAGYPLFRSMLIGLFSLSFGSTIRFGLLKEDISYEIYLVHMPVVNILLELTEAPNWGTFLTALGLTLLLALTLFQLNRRIINRLNAA